MGFGRAVYGVTAAMKGLAPLKAYFAAATFDDAPPVTESRFLAAYGRSVGSLWEDWRAHIRR